MTADDCANIVAYTPSDDVAYQPAVDVDGNAVAPADLDGWSFNGELGFPGEYPLTRGIYASMYRGRLWTMRQYAGFATAEETNKRFRYLLERGQTGLSTAFDLPTQIGYDSNHPMARGEVGRVGVAGSAVHEGLDHGSGRTRKRLGPLGGRGGFACGPGLGLDQAAQGQSGKSVAQARQDRSSRKRLNEHG